ncbi:MAG: hypothetical protein RLZZ501_724 [Pseudomonadota bacterium]|jgi:hypothetical protein
MAPGLRDIPPITAPAPEPDVPWNFEKFLATNS